jgi:hypothetical protein
MNDGRQTNVNVNGRHDEIALYRRAALANIVKRTPLPQFGRDAAATWLFVGSDFERLNDGRFKLLGHDRLHEIAAGIDGADSLRGFGVSKPGDKDDRHPGALRLQLTRSIDAVRAFLEIYIHQNDIRSGLRRFLQRRRTSGHDAANPEASLLKRQPHVSSDHGVVLDNEDANRHDVRVCNVLCIHVISLLIWAEHPRLVQGKYRLRI